MMGTREAVSAWRQRGSNVIFRGDEKTSWNQLAEINMRTVKAEVVIALRKHLADNADVLQPPAEKQRKGKSKGKAGVTP